MASKGPRSKLDHETRARRQKAFEAPREPPRPKAHWDHVLEEMIWLSKDFESERKWKLSQAKKVALRASKGMLDQATRGEKKLKEEEQRMRKVALNISKDVKKFWIKIEKLVLYKHQMDLDEKKKKALDKQLEFLLGQTERYSTMLAENLVDKPSQLMLDQSSAPSGTEEKIFQTPHLISEPQLDAVEDGDDDYDIHSEDGSEDDEHNVEEDEHNMEEDDALFTEEERQEELAALQNEVDLPVEELLKRYTVDKDGRESSAGEDGTGTMSTVKGKDEDKKYVHLFAGESDASSLPAVTGRRCLETDGAKSGSANNLLEADTGDTRNHSSRSRDKGKEDMAYDFNDEQEDGDFVLATAEENDDDEATLLEEEELAKTDANDPVDEISLLQKESEIPLEELIARYEKAYNSDEVSGADSGYNSALSEGLSDAPDEADVGPEQQDQSTVETVKSSDYLPMVHPSVKEQVVTGEVAEQGKDSEDRITDAAAAARSAQPTGNTFSTTKVRTKFPFLLKYPLREYQHIGLDWLVTMYEKRLNGILADEMGLGKTIMTIALLAHLACEKGIWGPHLIVVPTSVMLNWETEFLKWCPAFKILTYFGSAKERKLKRQGWLKPNSFHICITTYRLVIQDAKIFKRKKWKYLILDEAHLIKNWKSQRWQTLLNFNSKRRILLTGTPLQNDLMELWSLMHFLMPHVFQSHQEFKDWFSNPISGMVEGQERVNKEVLDRLHNVLRPFILRRLKRDVEKQLPMKHEHVIFCRLSKRQRNLYEDFIASSETQATLASTNFFGMISVIMQLRKVCNHPDLFEGRPIISSFDMVGLDIQLSSSICLMLSSGPFSAADLNGLGLLFTQNDFCMTSWESDEVNAIATPSRLIVERSNIDTIDSITCGSRGRRTLLGSSMFEEIRKAILEERLKEAKERATAIAWWNSLRCRRKPMYSTTLREIATIKRNVDDIHQQKVERRSYMYSSALADMVLCPIERLHSMIDLVESFMFAIPAARSPTPNCWCSKTGSPVFVTPIYRDRSSELLLPLLSPVRPAIVRRQVYFPDRRLIQFDCGKLQELAVLLRRLKSEGHRALIFTQMTKMLDVLEAFINLYGYTYMRLDGSTQPEERQTLMQRFNTNPKFFLFILSTRSGGVGINLVGADTVIFYDSDWNPAMDQQAQDRCHRIGQTREVHIYRLISESTIEENILKKANQKRVLDDLVIQSGGYNTEFFKKLDPMELFSGHKALPVKNTLKEKNNSDESEVPLSNADVDAALKYAEDEADYMALKKVEQEEEVDNQEFTEEAIGRLEDDECVDEDDVKVDEQGEQEISPSKGNYGGNLTENNTIEEKALIKASSEDDADMLADVRQMAEAAAAAGQAISSFETHLRPIDRYAIRYLELWDPIIDKAAIDTQDRLEEREWELDRIEKYKEEMEAEIDDDEEPLVYESWDADFATEAYRHQVEVLAQHQLMEELEAEAKKKQDIIDEEFETTMEGMQTNSKSKSKKKVKKTKFKSLKKGSLSSELKHVKKEPSLETLSSDDDLIDQDEFTNLGMMSSCSSAQKKRKKPEVEIDVGKSSIKKSKKLKKAPEVSLSGLNSKQSGKKYDDSMELKTFENRVTDLEPKLASRSKMGGKVSITTMPLKRVLMIKLEKIKKGNVWSRDYVPSPDSWLPQEDAILCAVVQEYGPNWSLVSDTLYGMTAGGFYRGRYRHPVHSCERYRELFQKHILSAPENLGCERMNNVGSGKGLLKVTEDNVRMLLNVAAEQPDHELLLQKHFTALLSSVWKVTCHNSSYFGEKSFSCASQTSQSSMNGFHKRVWSTNLRHSGKLLAAALRDVSSRRTDDGISLSTAKEAVPGTEGLEITLEFQEGSNAEFAFPPLVSLSIPGSDGQTSMTKEAGDVHLRSTMVLSETRYRDALRIPTEDSANDTKLRQAPKLQSSGKQKVTASESVVKVSRSKGKKASTTEEHSERSNNNPFGEPEFQNLLVKDELVWMSELEKESVSSICIDAESAVPHVYVPGLISDLEDCPMLQELSDIG
ncbi:Protein PHOTOPERIOD-INDEPENDENT EARLY FLOWERING 1 [Linum perenne]